MATLYPDTDVAFFMTFYFSYILLIFRSYFVLISFLFRSYFVDVSLIYPL